MFSIVSNGVTTARDSWVYNASQKNLMENISRISNTYNNSLGEAKRPNNSKLISWSRSLRKKADKQISHDPTCGIIRQASYRPFNKTNLYIDNMMIEVQAKMRRIFPNPETKNFGFYVVGAGSDKPFSVLATDQILDIAFWGSSSGQFFARYIYPEALEVGGLFDHLEASGQDQPVDNISDMVLTEFSTTLEPVTKDEIFYYVYGILQSPEYRRIFSADLKKMLPRMPMVSDRVRFRAFQEAGRQLAALHIGYEDVDPYPLVEIETGLMTEGDEYAKYSVTKMKYGGKAGSWDKTRIIYNGHLTLEGIPVEAHEYMLGSRSAIDWILERYQVKTDKASGIVNDPNDWSREHQQPRYVIDLIGRIVTVSMETNRIVNALPSLGLDEKEL